MAQGHCNCGAVQYEVEERPTDVFVCHCSICRRATGSAGIAVVLVPKSQFRWLAGENVIASWKKPDGDWEMWFCRQCGSPVPGENDPSSMFVPAGSVTSGGEGMRVAHHIWVGSKAVWDEIGDLGKQHLEGFKG